MVHIFKQLGFNIAMDVESGAIHILEDAAAEVLKLVTPPMSEECPESLISALQDKFSVSEIRNAYSELYELYKEGMLFTERDYEINIPEEYPIKALCLHIAHDCNLRCKYCFAEGGDYAKGRKIMPFEVAKAAIDFVIEKSGSRRNIEIDFFGGEPLMGFDTVKKTVEYARSIEKEHNKNFRFTLTTNGLLLSDEVMDYLNKEMSNVVLSLDGRKEVNDAVRVGVNNTGSYDRIVPKFQEFVKRRGGKDYYIRGTFTSANLDFAEDVKHMKELGFKQTSVEPVVLDPSSPFAIKEEHLPAAFAEYDRLTDIMAEYKKNDDFFNFFHFMVDLDQGPCVIKRVKGCGCGGEYVAVTPDGDVYPCHRFAGMEDFKMGTVFSGALKQEIIDKFGESTVLRKKDCEDCWAKYFCSGGCPANNYNSNGDILKPHKISCELERKRLECAIALKAYEACLEEDN